MNQALHAATLTVLLTAVACTAPTPLGEVQRSLDEETDAGVDARLVLLSESEPVVTFKTRVPVQVRYVDPANEPVPDTFISFAIEGDPAGTRLSEKSAPTNSDGVAETYIEAGELEVDFDLVISVPDDDTVVPLTVAVRVRPIVNLWPEIAGSYRIHSQPNLLDLIPDEAEEIPGPVGELYRDPGAGILRLIALAAGGDDYYDESPWKALFDLCSVSETIPFCESPGDVVLTDEGLAVAGVLEELVDLGLQAIPGSSGAPISTLFEATGDVFENVETFAMAGDFTITQEADESGLLGEENSVAFASLDWTWSGGEGSVRLRDGFQIDTTGIGAAIVGSGSTYDLHLDPYDLELNYGQLLIWVLEGIVLPEIFDDPAVDSFEEFFSTLLSCEDLRDLLSCSGPYAERECEDFGDALAEAAKLGCERLSTSAGATLGMWSTRNMAELQTVYRLGAIDPCPIQLNRKRLVRAFGGAKPASRCSFIGDLDFGRGERVAVPGAWWARRVGK